METKTGMQIDIRSGTPVAHHAPPPWTKVAKVRGRPTTKVSIGIVMCRINQTTRRPEAMMVHKRYTYEFNEFVHGRYSRHHLRTVTSLLDRMTIEELLDVWSLNFDQIWYRIWLTAEKKELYAKKSAKFHSSFIRDDGGKLLRELIRQTRGGGELLWEPPGGKHATPKESDIMCGIREMYEEARIEKRDYRILPGVRRRMSFTHMGVHYVKIYYAAIANPRLARQELTALHILGAQAAGDLEQMGEVSEAKWMDIIGIRAIDGPSKRLEGLIAPLFRVVRSAIAGRWAPRLGPFALSVQFERRPRRPPKPSALDISNGGSLDRAPTAEILDTSKLSVAEEGTWTIVKSKKRPHGADDEKDASKKEW